MRFTWGDSVRVIADAPECYRPGAIGSICGMRTADSDNVAEQFQCPIGSVIYIIEYTDGSSTEVPARLLWSAHR